MKGLTDIKILKRDKTAILNVEGAKERKLVGFKVVPSVPTDEQLAKINRFTRRQFTTDELYVGQLRLSNNCIDRDNERFSEEVLQRFVNTTLRKTLLYDHNRDIRENAIGKFFDVQLEKMPLQQAVAEIGEELVLPDGMTEVWFHSPWFYIPKFAVGEKVLTMIDAGVYDFASIGFRAESLVPVMDKDGDIRFWEYRGTGTTTEMREGSLCYLGAQHGMAVKSIDKNEQEPEGSIEDKSSQKNKDKNHGGDMDKFLKILNKVFPGKSFSEDALGDELKTAIEDMTKAAVTSATEALNAKITELTPLAADGKAYREELITKYVTLKTKLEEIPADDEVKQTGAKKVAGGFPIDFLKSEGEALQKRVDEKFPDVPGVKPQDPNANRGTADDKGEKGEKKKHPLDPEAEE